MGFFLIMGWLLVFVMLVLVPKYGNSIHTRTKKIYSLILLRRELENLASAEHINKKEKTKLTSQTDILLRKLAEDSRIETADQVRDYAWKILCEHMQIPTDTTSPWKPTEQKTVYQKAHDYIKSTLKTPAKEPEHPGPAKPSIPPPVPPVKKTPVHEEPQKPPEPKPVIPAPSSPVHTTATPVKPQKPSPIPDDIVKEQDEATRHAWQPSEPGIMEHSLQKVSGWSKLALPFMVQNIMWFVSGFFFVAGSVFLVIYTQDFIRSLIVSLVVSGYTLMMLFGAYQMKRRRPELHTVSNVLITLGMFLIPLSIAASIRLIDAGTGSSLTTGAGIFVTAVNFGVFYWTAQLSSGIMDRTLQGLHPRLFILMAGIQLAVPFFRFSFFTFHILALLHLALLGILGYGLFCFINDWLKSIFSDQRKLAWYAAGTLVYSGLVSFVHLAVSFETPLPDGYYGPFVMVLSGLLFFVDSRFKEWTKRYAFLSRFSFAVYGVSIIALVITFNAPCARLITLVLGICVYGIAVRNYLTLPPLYLLLICMGWLYAQAVLSRVTSETHFLSSLPALGCLMGMIRWSLGRKAWALALLLFRVLIILVPGLVIWSLYNSSPGWTATITGLTLTSLVYIILCYVPLELVSSLRPDSDGKSELAGPRDLRNSPWFYAATLSAILPLAYLPVLKEFVRASQFAICLVLLSTVWTAFGLIIYRKMAEKVAIRVTVFLNSALLNILLALATSSIFLHYSLIPPFSLLTFYVSLLLFFSGCILLWQGTALRVRCLFFIGLALTGAAGAIFKRIFFPGITVGLGTMLLAMAVWWGLWYLERYQKPREKLLDDIKDKTVIPTLTLLWLFPTGKRSLSETIIMPLQVAMAVLWGRTMFRLGQYFYIHKLTLKWGLNVGLGTLTTMMMAAYFRLSQLWPVPVLMGLAAVLACVCLAGWTVWQVLCLTAVLYALAAWILTRKVAASPFTLRVADILCLRKGNQGKIEQLTHWTAYVIISAGITLAVCGWLIKPGLSILPALLTSMIFLWLAGQCYWKRLHSYNLLGLAVITALVVHTRVLSVARTTDLLTDIRTPLLFALLSISMWAFAKMLQGIAVYEIPVSSEQDSDIDFARSLYRRPLRVMAVVLALTGAFHQLALFLTDPSRSVSFLAILVIASASTGLFLANHRLSNPILALIGTALACLALLWTEFRIFHNQAPFSLQPARIPWDQWVSLALISLLLAFPAHYLSRYPRQMRLYCQPLRCVAAVCFGWSLLELIPVFTAGLNPDIVKPYGLLLFLVWGITLFPLLKPFDDAPHFRGMGILILVTGFAATLLSLTGIHILNHPVLPWLLLAWAYILWGLANEVLPRINARWPGWRISPAVWPWTGLILIWISLFVTGAGKWHFSFIPAELFAPINYGCLAGGSLYFAMMRQNSKWGGFSWLAATGFVIVGFGLIHKIMIAVGISQTSAQWLNLGLLASGLAFLAHYLAIKTTDSGEQKTNPPKSGFQFLFFSSQFKTPVYVLASAAFAWSLIGAVFSTVSTMPGQDIYASCTFLILAFALFPLLRPFSKAFGPRGIGVALLLSSAWFGFINAAGVTPVFGFAAFVWAYLLWGLANFALPRFNKRWSKWSLDPLIWPLLGLFIIVFSTPAAEGIKNACLNHTWWLALSVYLFLLLRNTSLQGFSYLATGALTAAGIIFVWKLSGVTALTDPVFEASILALANLLLCVVPLWRRYGRTVTNRMNWQNPDLANSFLAWPFLILGVFLILSWIADMAALFPHGKSIIPQLSLWIRALLTVSFLHLFLLRHTYFHAHSLVFALLNMAMAAKYFISLPLLLALWTGALCIPHFFWRHRQWSENRISIIRKTLSVWLVFCPWLATTALLLVPVKSFAETLLTLGLLTGIMAGLGWQRRQSGLLWTARIAGLALLHAWPFMFLPSSHTSGIVLLHIWPLLEAHFVRIQVLLPWYALQLAVLVWLLIGLHSLLLPRLEKKWPWFQNMFRRLPFEAGLALGEWILHMILFMVQLESMHRTSGLTSGGTAALIAVALLIALGVWVIHRSRKARWVYSVALLTGMAGVYLRLLLVGLAPISVSDTVAIMGAAYVLFMIQRFTLSAALSAPLLHLALLVPLVALLTVPFQLASAHTGATLVAAGALYLSLRFTSGSSVALYLSVLTLNAAIYLWVPAWAGQYNLIQLYIVPACLSVLILLHLHRKELKRSVLNNTRLAAVSTLYICASLDFFLKGDLSYFVLAIGLSLAGMGIGIGLRIRAFLYAGVIFMVMNVVGQLVLFYSKQTVWKGIVLVLVGAVIMGVTFLFDIQKEAIVKRFRLLRTDMETWD
ncbi:MAG: hypothetical protein GY749_43775 [Desulfobacteraceae bacterium]|nr:hypothetical protein [Desulfobacteraceae bacterium]